MLDKILRPLSARLGRMLGLSPKGIRALLVGTSLQKLKTTVQTLTILRASATVDEALKALAAAKILSAPVVTPDEEGPEGDEKEGPLWPSDQPSTIEGFLDISEVLTSFLKEVDMEQLLGMNLMGRMRYLEERGATFATKRLEELPDLGTDGDFLHSSQAKSSLLELIMYALLDPKNRGMHGGAKSRNVVHRVALFDNQGRITSIISQTDIIKFLAHNTSDLGDIASASVESLGLVSNNVESIAPSLSAIEAMQRMAAKKLSSMAVVDPNGNIMGNFSISEMRTIVAEHFGSLALPVAEFLALEHGQEYTSFNKVHEVQGESKAGASSGHKFVTDRVARRRPRTPGEDVGQELVLCRRGSTLGEVINMLVKHRIHRVYVVDDEEKPIGIVTHTDILRAVCKVCQA